jgi:hypothetical protein
MFFVRCGETYVLVGLGERVSRHGGYQLNRKKMKRRGEIVEVPKKG